MEKPTPPLLPTYPIKSRTSFLYGNDAQVNDEEIIMFKAIARLFSAADNAMQIVENITEAGAIASQSTVKLATQFDNKQQAILDNMDAKIKDEIAKAKADNRDVNFDDI